ncbi:hypothetical protein N7468_005331 [Penicillium chermesinum]|uniref:Cytochrome P450 n=1 Tax=Penicillium chermesinum TaxID=63820 RepID=A0A9W9TMW3_9EURO|nr:uncharacterized protein N7468_005331 [Penicillium chermesinum]KAJ5232375.1 hypothetical protein N7468_005331 [Penicillium chermesinum]
MSFTFVLGFAAAAVVLQLLRLVVNSWYHARKAQSLGCGSLPRYPCKDPFGIGTLRESMAADKEKRIPELSEQRVQLMADRENRFVTTFITRNLGNDIIFTIEPRNVQAVLATQFKDFELGGVRRLSMHPLLGTGIFTADGEEWSRSRSLLRPQFTRDQISQLDLEEGHVKKAMQCMPVADNGWTAETDIQSIFFRLTIDSATEFLFGESAESQLGVLNGREDPKDSFAYYFDKSQHTASVRTRFEKLAFLVDNKETRYSDKRVHDYVDKFVAIALRNAENPKHDLEKGPYVFLDALAATTRDPIELRSQLLNILLAGRDTTASLLSWTTLMLARHPHIFQKLRESIIETFGTYSNPKNLTFADLKSCQALQYCMNESLRLYPSSHLTVAAPRATLLFLPAAALTAHLPYTVHVIHRRKDIWGPDADEFKPERWANRKAGWEYVPFNGGPRICIGQQFALTEAGYVLVRLLQRFDKIEDVYPERKIRYGLTLTSCPADLVTVRMHQADDA